MSLPALSRLSFAGLASFDAVARLLTTFQDNVAAVLNRIQKRPRLDAVDVGLTVLTGATDVAVPHKLGRQPQGWDITDQTAAAATVHRVAWSKETITLRASATCSVALEVW